MDIKNNVAITRCWCDVRTYCYRIANTIIECLLPAGYISIEYARQDSEIDNNLNITDKDQYESSINVSRVPISLSATENKLTNPRLEYLKKAIRYKPKEYTSRKINTFGVQEKDYYKGTNPKRNVRVNKNISTFILPALERDIRYNYPDRKTTQEQKEASKRIENQPSFQQGLITRQYFSKYPNRKARICRMMRREPITHRITQHCHSMT